METEGQTAELPCFLDWEVTLGHQVPDSADGTQDLLVVSLAPVIF